MFLPRQSGRQQGEWSEAASVVAQTGDWGDVGSAVGVTPIGPVPLKVHKASRPVASQVHC